MAAYSGRLRTGAAVAGAALALVLAAAGTAQGAAKLPDLAITRSGPINEAISAEPAPTQTSSTSLATRSPTRSPSLNRRLRKRRAKSTPRRGTLRFGAEPACL
jgi:hypothetical protein